MADDQLSFVGKFVLFSGDLPQILPVVPKASRGAIVHMCLKSTVIFSELHVQRLTENMRLKALKEDPNAETAALKYPEYLLGVGGGRLKLDEDSNIYLTLSINVVQSSSELIDAIFGDISAKYSDTECLTSRAMLATTTQGSNLSVMKLSTASQDDRACFVVQIRLFPKIQKIRMQWSLNTRKNYLTQLMMALRCRITYLS